MAAIYVGCGLAAFSFFALVAVLCDKAFDRWQATKPSPVHVHETEVRRA